MSKGSSLINNMAKELLNTVITPEAKAENEWVAGVQTKILFENGYWQGFKKISEKEVFDLVANHLEFRCRTDKLEKDTTFKQIIPYFLIKEESKYYISSRTNKSGDMRAHGFMLIGFGGHLRKKDIVGPMKNWLKREFEEEIDAEKIDKIEFLGILNNDSEELGGINKVHFGLVFVVNTKGAVKIRERDKLEPGTFITPKEIRKNKEKLETWSKILADYI